MYSRFWSFFLHHIFPPLPLLLLLASCFTFSCPCRCFCFLLFNFIFFIYPKFFSSSSPFSFSVFRIFVKHTNLLFLFSRFVLFVGSCVFLKPYVIVCFLRFNSEPLLLLFQRIGIEFENKKKMYALYASATKCLVSIYFANLAPFYQQLKNIMFQFFQSIFPIFSIYALPEVTWVRNRAKKKLENESKRKICTYDTSVAYHKITCSSHTHTGRIWCEDALMFTAHTIYVAGPLKHLCVPEEYEEKLAVASGSDLSPTLHVLFCTVLFYSIRHTHAQNMPSGNSLLFHAHTAMSVCK